MKKENKKRINITIDADVHEALENLSLNSLGKKNVSRAIEFCVMNRVASMFYEINKNFNSFLSDNENPNLADIINILNDMEFAKIDPSIIEKGSNYPTDLQVDTMNNLKIVAIKFLAKDKLLFNAMERLAGRGKNN